MFIYSFIQNFCLMSMLSEYNTNFNPQRRKNKEQRTKKSRNRSVTIFTVFIPWMWEHDKESISIHDEISRHENIDTDISIR